MYFPFLRPGKAPLKNGTIFSFFCYNTLQPKTVKIPENSKGVVQGHVKNSHILTSIIGSTTKVDFDNSQKIGRT